MNNNQQTAYIVDDDAAIRDSLSMLLDSVGISNRCFANAQEFLDTAGPDARGCLVSDIRMPGISGLELLDEIISQKILLPVIFITGHGDIPMAVEAMRRGALDFLHKPFREQDLLDRIDDAFNGEQQRWKNHFEAADAKDRISALSKREREIFELVSSGLANKVIATDLGISERTVEVHRANVMRKVHAGSLAELVRIKLLADQAVVDGR